MDLDGNELKFNASINLVIERKSSGSKAMSTTKDLKSDLNGIFGNIKKIVKLLLNRGEKLKNLSNSSEKLLEFAILHKRKIVESTVSKMLLERRAREKKKLRKMICCFLLLMAASLTSIALILIQSGTSKSNFSSIPKQQQQQT